ncbi:MBL fold metallo-hydrolase [Sphingomonas sp. AOB5]|uniref:MBL fold metallo-hydrolase n=1 Tax=Sphingomonas sp. AOB5 TaxID=3034017 RepID=UPI0023F75C1F|nr:MBL fold metallo-hydrolase [Sphingomonas sp. AOB5]MDF7775171.1 MBL fold metallo-hydrolase [Sphingomonas sp. AOB5]
MRIGWAGLAAVMLAVPASAQQMVRVGPDVQVLTGTSGNVVMARVPGGVLIVDDERPGDVAEIEAAAQKAFGAPVVTVINTHWHLDHSGGNAAFRGKGASVIAHRNVCIRRSTDQFMPAYNRTIPAAAPGELPDVLFDDSLALFAGGEVVTLTHAPNAHTDGDAIVRFGGANLIHMGDLYFNGIWPFIDRASGGSVQGMIRAVDVALERADAKTVIVPAHGALSDRAGLKRYRAMLVGVRDAVRRRIARGETLAQVVAAKPAAKWRAGMVGNEDGFVGAVYESLKVGVAPSPGIVARGVCAS